MKVAIAGCTGRMGQVLTKAIQAANGMTLVGGSVRPGFDGHALKTILNTMGCADLIIDFDADALAAKADAIIDFTSPQATLEMAEAVARRGGIHIIGTTGFSAGEQETLEQCAKRARIVQSGNFSLGVNVLERLVKLAAQTLNEEYDIEISEMHHRHKKDAPSGTALMLGRAAAQGRGVALAEKKISDREGMTGERRAGDIGFCALRGGDVVGMHSVLFAGPGEIIELKHQGFSRDIYAQGALRAARWAQDKPPGLYSIQDMLSL